jgi:hypothetical protein
VTHQLGLFLMKLVPDSSERDFLVSRLGELLRCSDDNLVVVEGLADSYERVQQREASDSSRRASKRSKDRAQDVVRLFMQLPSTPESILDVGCGDGSGLSYSVGRDLLRQPSAVAIEGVWKIVGGVPVAVSPTAYRLSADGTEIIWLSAVQSPAAGSSYAISYRYLPRYVVQNDLGMRPPTVRGQALPCAVLVRRAGGTIEG